jgi:hypothetical protein
MGSPPFGDTLRAMNWLRVRSLRAWVAVAVLALGLAVVAAAEDENRISWADAAHQHGWAEVTSGGSGMEGEPPQPHCPGTQRSTGSIAFLCATENGGRSWRRIFRAGEGLMYLRGFTRTSLTAGVVAVSRDDALPRTLRSGVFWTSDNGAHWYETTKIGPLVESRGGRLFWRTLDDALYQVRPWPPRGAVKCPGFFAWHVIDQHPRATGNVCVGGTVNAGMVSTRVP